MDYRSKYLKYKKKYKELKKGGGILDPINDNLDFFFRFNTDKTGIMTKYNNFNNLQLIETPMKKMGNASANGFIFKIKFRNNRGTFDTILKTSIQKSSDNNYYEYIVGNCINKFKEYYPNFVYTFNYLNLSESLKYILYSSQSYSNLPKFIADANIKNININELQNYFNIGKGCENNNRASVLIEFIPNSLSINELMTNRNFISSDFNINIELFNILFQIYATLSGLKEVYTHYDLHLQNIMFIEIPDGKKIQIEYKIDKIYTIYTSYIPVILDYGRSFVDCLKIDNTIYSKIFAEVICNNPKCNSLKHPQCSSRDVGVVIDKDATDNYSKQEDFYNINLRNKNESFDLRYLHNFMLNIPESLPIKIDYRKYFNKETDWVTRDITGKVKTNYLGKPIINFGVKENLSDINISHKISNTTDCFEWLVGLYNTIYNVAPPVPANIYGVMKINYNFNEREKWTFEKK